MPAGGGGKPAGGYRAGKKGSYGCSGYPTVSADGTVHGCHKTKAQAQAQARAIWASTSQKAMGLSKAMVVEGDFVAFICHDEEMKVGRVEYVMNNSGILGMEGSEYALEYMEDDKPLIIRLYEEEDGVWEEEEYVVYHRMSEVIKIESITVMQESEVEMTSKSAGEDNDMWSVFDPRVIINKSEISLFAKRDYKTDARRRMAESGQAMPDGSFPIADRADLRNAIQSVGRAANYEAAKRHIIRRARALGATDMLPEDWK